MGIKEDVLLIETEANKLPNSAQNRPMRGNILAAAGRLKADLSTPPTLQSIALEPSAVELQPGQSQTFVARALWSDGSTAVPALVWSASAGSVTQAGVFTAGSAAGTGSVSATGGGRTGTATVKVMAPMPEPEPEPPTPGVEYLFAANNGIVSVGSVVDVAGGAADLKPTWTRTNPYPGDTESLEFTYGGNPDLADDAWSEYRVKLLRGSPDLFFKWFQYFPGPGDAAKGSAPYSHRDAAGADNNKLLRAWVGDVTDGRHGYGKYYHKCGLSTNPTPGQGSVIIPEYGTMTATGTQTGVGQFGLAGTGQVIDDTLEGKWNLFRARLRPATSATAKDGIISLELNGTTILHHTTIPFFSLFAAAKRAFEYAYFLGWSNSGFSLTTKIWVARPLIALARIP